MNSASPNDPSEVKLETEKGIDPLITKIAKGQKNIIYAVLLNILGHILTFIIGPFAAVFLLIAFFAAIIGIIQVSKGMEYSVITIIFLFVLLLIPLISILMLIVLNARATSRIRQAGHRVGLLGAKLK